MNVLSGLLFAIGAALTVAGVKMINVPAAFIVAGVILLLVGVLFLQTPAPSETEQRR